MDLTYNKDYLNNLCDEIITYDKLPKKEQEGM